MPLTNIARPLIVGGHLYSEDLTLSFVYINVKYKRRANVTNARVYINFKYKKDSFRSS